MTTLPAADGFYWIRREGREEFELARFRMWRVDNNLPPFSVLDGGEYDDNFIYGKVSEWQPLTPPQRSPKWYTSENERIIADILKTVEANARLLLYGDASAAEPIGIMHAEKLRVIAKEKHAPYENIISLARPRWTREAPTVKGWYGMYAEISGKMVYDYFTPPFKGSFYEWPAQVSHWKGPLPEQEGPNG